LAFCRLFVLSSFRGEKTTIIVLAFCRSVIFSRRKDDKMTKRQSKRRQIRSLISGLCLSSFRPNFVVLSTLRFVVCRLVVLSSFWGEKRIIIVLSSRRFVVFSPRQNEKTTKSLGQTIYQLAWFQNRVISISYYTLDLVVLCQSFLFLISFIMLKIQGLKCSMVTMQKSTSHLGNISSIGTKNVNVYSNKVFLFYIFIPIIILWGWWVGVEGACQ
jgi:hypothetical protein